MINKKDQYEINAVRLFRSSDTAVLSTISQSSDSYPFGSFVTFSSSTHRELVIYASDIAEHTKNILHDPRACATIFSTATDGDKQTSARLSLIGDLVKVETDGQKSYESRFIKFLPESKEYSRMHGFNFYKLNINKARWIGGFGQIGWLDIADWITKTPAWKEDELSMIKHMNDDHHNVVYSALNANFGVADQDAKMLALCTDGYFVLSEDQRYFIAFEEPCYSAGAIRAALVNHAKAYRSFEL